MFVIIARPDFDCDGFSCGYHRVSVSPAELAALGNVDERDCTEFIAHLMENDRAGFYDDASACMVMSAKEFFQRIYRSLDAWHKDYFRRVGYASSGLRPWN